MKIKIKRDSLIVVNSFFETSILYLLPILLLPLINEGHYRYMHLYLTLAIPCIWLYIYEMRYPIIILTNNILNFREFRKYSYLNGLLKFESISHELTKIPLIKIANIDFDYPIIFLLTTDSEQFKIALKLSDKNFLLIKEELLKYRSYAAR